MNEHPSYLVFQHLKPFLESRNLQPAATADLEISRDKFITELEHIGYFRLIATGEDDATVVILILAIDGNYTTHGPALKGLIKSLGTEVFKQVTSETGTFLEVIIIVPEDVMKKKNMTDAVKKFSAQERGAGAAQTVKNVARYYNIYPYHVLSLDVPRAQIVPRHEIVSPADARAFLARERLSARDLKRVPATNPPVIWIGARPGDVVRIRSPSESAGIVYDYCLVI